MRELPILMNGRMVPLPQCQVGGVRSVTTFDAGRLNEFVCPVSASGSRSLHSLIFGRETSLHIADAKPLLTTIAVRRRDGEVAAPSMARTGDVRVNREITNLEDRHA